MGLINDYVEFMNDSYNLMKCSSNESYRQPFWSDFFHSIINLCRMNNYYQTEFVYIIAALCVISLIRYLIFDVICDILVSNGFVLEKHRNKFCHDFWIFIFRTPLYLLAWNIYNETDTFENMGNVHMIIPFKIRFLYLISISEYIHSTGLLLFGYHHDKDAPIWIIHHLIGVLILILSYIIRQHLFIVAGIFMMEITDIFVFSKFALKLQIHLIQKYINHVRIIFFPISLFVWCFSRLYAYPLILSPLVMKNFYQLCHLERGSIYLFLHGLSIFVHITNIYWTFTLTKVTLILIRKGSATNIEDAREFNFTIDEKKIH